MIKTPWSVTIDKTQDDPKLKKKVKIEQIHLKQSDDKTHSILTILRIATFHILSSIVFSPFRTAGYFLVTFTLYVFLLEELRIWIKPIVTLQSELKIYLQKSKLNFLNYVYTLVFLANLAISFFFTGRKLINATLYEPYIIFLILAFYYSHIAQYFHLETISRFYLNGRKFVLDSLKELRLVETVEGASFIQTLQEIIISIFKFLVFTVIIVSIISIFNLMSNKIISFLINI